MTDTMTPKQRWLATIRMEAVDRLVFWPKLNASYPPAQALPFRDMDINTIHEWIGSDRHTGVGVCVKETRTTTGVETIQDNATMRTVYQTPHGRTELIQKFDEPSFSWHPVKFPVETLDDIKLMTEIFSDVTVELDQEALDQTRQRVEAIGQNAVTAATIGKSPLMHWVEFLAGVKNAHWLLADYPDDVEKLFDAMHRVLLRKTEILCDHCPADLLYLMENTSTTLISPDQYRRYCAPYIGQCATITNQANRNLVLHMCGHLKALLDDLRKIPAQAFEAFTSPTLGNTTLLDGRTHCPDTCLIGGTNAVLWTKPAEKIIEQTETDLNALDHHRGIAITSAGVMPPLCRPETIKQVRQWLEHYPVRL